MHITDWDLKNAGDLSECYNQHIIGLPYCYSISPEAFTWGIQRDRYHAEPFEMLHSDRLIVSNKNGLINGFIHIATEERKRDDQPIQNGTIRFISYPPGNRLLGQALLSEAERHFRDQSIYEINAFNHMYRFYHPDHGHCEKHGHITGLLGINDYTISNAPKMQINMAWEHLQTPEPLLPDNSVEIEVEQIEGYGGLPNLIVRSLRDGKSFGSCESYSLSHLQRTDRAQDKLLVRWLGVNDSKQTRGWGLYLLQRTLWEAQQIGYKHSLISTGVTNHRALLCYANYGYQVIHSSHAYVKTLTD